MVNSADAIMGYIPGAVKKRCFSCNKKYYADENSVQCKPCAEKDQEEFNALLPDHREERIKAVEEFMDSLIVRTFKL